MKITIKDNKAVTLAIDSGLLRSCEAEEFNKFLKAMDPATAERLLIEAITEEYLIR